MASTKALKACSIEEVERAIAKAISGLTGTEVSATVRSLLVNDDSVAAFNGQDTFKVELSLRVGKSYSD